MSSLNDSRAKLDRMMAAREQVAERLAEVDDALGREMRWLGWLTKGSILPLIAFACGIRLAVIGVDRPGAHSAHDPARDDRDD